jgi:hypothetical protein
VRRIVAVLVAVLVVAGAVAPRAAVARRRRAAKHKVVEKKPPPAPKRPPPVTTGYPTACEIDKFLVEASSLETSEREPEAIALMTRLMKELPPKDRDRLELWDYFLARWAALFRLSGYMDMLEAVDDSPAGGAFLLPECNVFYRAVLKDTRAVEHYRYQAKRGGLAICFEPDEQAHLLKLPVEGGGRLMPGRGLTSVSACQTDELLAGLAEGGLRARRIQETVAKAGMGDDGDPVGRAYLMRHLASYFRANPDEAILAGFESAWREAPEKRTCELYQSGIQSKAACAVFKEHYKTVTALPERCLTDDIKRCFAP